MSVPAADTPAASLRQALLQVRARLETHPRDARALDEAAVLLYQAGQPKPACDYARRAAQAAPRDPFILDHLGVILLAAERPAEAVEAARRATALSPRESAFWINLGNAQLAAGSPADSALSLARATTLAPRDPRSWFNLGNALAQNGRRSEAVAAYRKAVVLDPALVPARRNLALLLREAGHPADAAGVLAPLAGTTDFDLLHLLGILRLEAGDPAAALAPLQTAAQMQPEELGAQLDLARCLVRLARHQEAEPLCARLARSQPDNATVWNLLGLCTADDALALAAFRHALERNPAFADAAVNLARRLVDTDRTTEALEILDTALATAPHNPELHYTRGVALLRLDRSREALAANCAALAARADYPNARWNKALCELRLGDFTAGWPDYEWRWHHETHEQPRFGKTPVWPADNPKSGHLLLWSEQGVGDEVMFAGLLPAVRPLVDRLTVTCCPRLVPLFTRSFPGITFVAQAPDRRVPDPAIAADWQLPLGSLPARFWTPAGPPGEGRPTLIADPVTTAQLRERYRTDHRPAVGLAWRTGNAKNGRQRTIGPETWAPLLRDLPFRFVSLQYGDCTAELAAAAAAGLQVFHDPAVDQMHDLDAFAAQIAALDAVLTIDNSTVHFAGALGRPTWLLTPTPADWRWRTEGDTTVWYQSVRIRRKPAGGDWAPVLAAAVADLARFLQPAPDRSGTPPAR